MKHSGFATRAIHAGQEPDPATGAVSVPIYATSTYVQEEIGKHKGYEYARVSNPTRDRLETNLAALEGGTASRVFASGMAAINAIVTMLKSGDHVVAGHNLYGGTPRLFDQVLVNFGLTFTYVDTSDFNNVERAFQKNTRLIFLESPTNPLMQLCDLRAICELSHRHGVEVVVDNTFMSPYFQRPIELGADMLVHSTTKFLNGDDAQRAWDSRCRRIRPQAMSARSPIYKSRRHHSPRASQEPGWRRQRGSDQGHDPPSHRAGE